MTDDALLSTPARSASLDSSGWQEGRMDEHQGRLPQGRVGQGAWEAPWLATGGHPVGANPFSPSHSGGRPVDADSTQATGHYGPGYGDLKQHHGTEPQGNPQPHTGHDDHHHHYQRFRADHERQLDEDYAAYRRHRFASEFEQWRNGRQEAPAPREEGPLKSLGRAVSETLTGTREPDLQGGSDRFFERS
jgi:hypothetical protein